MQAGARMHERTQALASEDLRILTHACTCILACAHASVHMPVGGRDSHAHACAHSVVRVRARAQRANNCAVFHVRAGVSTLVL
eukprot:3711110-Lingulodinium_polyedra.AAC.1